VVSSFVKKFGPNLSDLDVLFTEDSTVADSLDLKTIFYMCAKLRAFSINVWSNAQVISRCAKDLSKLHFADLQQ
jgi:hypothetical protein